MPTIGRTEVIVIAIILLLLFGGKKIPEFVRSLGNAINEYRKSKKD